jgi:hypothetical protein
MEKNLKRAQQKGKSDHTKEKPTTSLARKAHEFPRKGVRIN